MKLADGTKVFDVKRLRAASIEKGNSPSVYVSKKEWFNFELESGEELPKAARYRRWKHRDVKGMCRDGSLKIKLNCYVAINLKTGATTYCDMRHMAELEKWYSQ